MPMQTFLTQNGKVGIITDQHFGARNDSPVFHKYFKKFYDDIFFPYLLKNDIQLLLNLGDVTDKRKFCNFFTLSIIREYFINKLVEYGIEMITTVGNHDCYFKNTNKVNSVSELFSEVSNIYTFTAAEEIKIDNQKILLVPWINDENQEESLQRIEKTDAKICMGHLELMNFNLNSYSVSTTGMDPKLLEKFDLVGTGHYHHKSSQGKIHYLGSPYEMTFADVNDPRGFHVWDTKGYDLEFIRNPYQMFHKIYYDDSKNKSLGQLTKQLSDNIKDSYVKVVVKNKTNPDLFNKFLKCIFDFSPEDVKIEEDSTIEFSTSEIDITSSEDTLSILCNHIDSLELNVNNKDEIKMEIKAIHNEALNLEG